MESPQNGTNSTHSVGGDLVKSLLDSATLSPALDDNSSLLNLGRKLENPASIDPLSSLSNFSNLNTAALNSSSTLSNQTESSNPKNTFGTSNGLSLFSNNSFGLTSSSYPTTSYIASNNSDPLTGSTKNTPLVSTAGFDPLTGTSSPTNLTSAVATSVPLLPRFAIKSEGTVSVNGGGDFDGEPAEVFDDALIYAGKGFTIKGNTLLPVQRDTNGNPLLDANGKFILVDKAVSVAPGYTVSNATSNKYANLLPPQTVSPQTVTVPAYDNILQRELLSRTSTGTTEVLFNAAATPLNNAFDWTNKFPPSGTATRPTIVRVTGGGITIPSNVNLGNYIIIVDRGDINFNGSGHNLNNCVLVAKAGNINLSAVQSSNLSVFASGSINMNAGARFSGKTLLASGSSSGSITFNGATKTTNNSDNLTVISQGSITYNGASSCRGTFISALDFTFNGKSTLYGSIGAKGNIIFNGNPTLVADFNDPAPPVITAALVKDTAPGGKTNTDKITYDSTIQGTVSDANLITGFKAGFNNISNSSNVSVLSYLGADGSFSFTPTQLAQIAGGTLPDGVHTLHLQAQDFHGNSNVFDFTFTLDTKEVAPTLLQLDAASDTGSSNSDRITNNATPKITGIANPGAIIELTSGGSSVGQTLVKADGTWLLATNNLADGSHNLTATATDVAGNVSPTSTPLNIVVDTIAPAAPTNFRLTAATDTGASNSDNITNNPSPTITGSAEAGSLVQLFQNDVLVGQTKASETGTWLVGVGSLEDGRYKFTAKALDLAGNLSTTSQALFVVIDTTISAPTAVDLPAPSDSGQSNSDRITNINTPPITGNAEAGAVVKLFSDGQEVGQATAASTNTWLFSIPQQLADGVHNITATATDVAGNVSAASAPLWVTVDTASPRLTLTTLVDATPIVPGTRLTGSVDGTGTAVTQLSYSFDDKPALAVAFNPTTGAFDNELNLTGLTNGPHTLTLTATDIAGNISTVQLNVVVNLDTTPPAIVAQLAQDTAPGGSTNSDRITTDPTISGSVTDASRVVELRAGFDTNPTSNFTDITAWGNTDGSFTLNRSVLDTIYGSSLPDGDRTLHLVGKDEYGNVSPVFDFAFTLDTTPPAEPIFNLDFASDYGIVGDRQTVYNTVTLVGQTSPNAALFLAQTGASTTADNNGRFQFQAVSLAVGYNSFTVTATDIAGNSSTATTIIKRYSLPTDIALDNNIIAENSATGSVIGQLSTADLDTEDTYTYTLVNDGGGRFKIVGSQLLVAQGTLLDFESNSSHIIEVKTEDSNGNSFTKQFTIGVANVNEFPTGVSLSNNTIAENTAIGTIIGDFSTSDPDGGDRHSYTLSDDAGGRFSIVNNSLQVATPLDYESGMSYRIQVIGTDIGGLATSQQFTINIANVNEAPTDLALSHTSVVENVPVNTVVGTFASSDPDALDSHTVSLVAGVGDADNAAFAIQGDRLLLLGAPDFETKSTYSIRVRTVDAGGLSAEQVFTIAVSNSDNEAPVEIRLSEYSVAENSNLGTVIGLLSTQDQDANDIHSYTLVDDAGGRFRIVGNELQVADGTLLDFETNPRHSITVRSTDSGTPNLFFEQTFTIVVTNVNEAPRFTSAAVKNADAEQPYTYRITTADPDSGDTRSITAPRLPDWLTLTDNGDGTATLSGTPNFANLGTHGIFLQVTDATGASSRQNFILGVNASLIEATHFSPTRTLSLSIPSEPSILSFKIDPVVFDSADPNSINDAVEVALVDAQGNSLVHTIAPGRDAFFNWTEGEPMALGAGTTYNAATHTVSLNLTGLTPGRAATLIFRLVNNDSDTTTNVSFKDFAIEAAGVGTLPVIATPPVSPTTTGIGAAAFNSLVDVSPSFTSQYRGTSFNADTSLLYADLSIKNIGSYGVDTPLLVAISHISDPSILVRADGFTPEGLPYYNFSHLVSDSKLDPNELTASRSLVFYNPNGVQFTYDLVVLAQLNAAPVIKTNPGLEAIAQKAYRYDVNTTDPNGDALTYELLIAPDGMTIDPNSGQIGWNPTTANVGNQSVLVQVSDSRGGIDRQSYTLSVMDAPPNRPPLFTSIPIASANINQLYTYFATAQDPDDDNLSFSLVSGPSGMAIDSTGKVTWMPKAESLGTVTVTIKVEDGLGGEATQQFAILTQPQAGNQAPVFTTEPVTLFNLAKALTATKGNVSPQIIDLDLPGGAVATKDITLTLPNDGTSGADIVFAVDESGSMGDARAWIANMVLDLEAALKAAGIGPNRYAFIGYGPGVIYADTFSLEEPVNLYTIDGRAQERLFFDLEPDAVSGFSWSLLRPDGQILQSGSSDLEAVLPVDGTYLLLVQQAVNATRIYDFKVFKSETKTTALVLGNLVTGALGTPGQQDAYTFNGSAGQRLYFDGISGSSSLDVRLTSPSGAVILNNIDVNSNNSSFVLPEAGTYALTVDGVTDAIGDYSFRLLENGSTLALDNTAVNGTLAAGQTTVYQLAGNTGQHLYLNSLKSASGTWRVLGPVNQQLANTSLSSDLELTLPGDGNYWLVLENTTDSAIDYSFAAGISQFSLMTLTLGSLVTDGINAAGEQDAYTFNGSTGQRLYFDGISGSSSLDVRLVSPSGAVILNNIDVNSNNGSFVLPEAGTYTLTIDGVGDAIGNYSFRLWDTGSNLILDNTAVNGTLAAGQTTVYQLAGNTGQHLYLNSLKSASGTWRVLGPTNQQLANTSLSSDLELTLPGDGSYWLVLENTTANPMDYSFTAGGSQPSSTVLTLGSLVTSRISAAGEQDAYTFNGSTGQRLYFDGISGSSSLDVRLVSPSGAVILNNIDVNSNNGSFVLPEAGTYTLVVDGVGDVVGDYNFRLWDSGNALALNNTAITGRLGALETVIYQLDGNAGQRLFFDSLRSASGTWRLLGASNQQLATNNLSTDFGLTLSGDGKYWLVLENTSASAVDYSFAAQASSDAPMTASGFGTLHSGTIAAGQQQNYTFTANAGSFVYFDSQDVDSDPVTVVLTDPSGIQVFSTSASTDQGVLTLNRAGTYSLTFRGNTASATGDYGFQMLNLSDGASLSLNTLVSGSLASKDAANVYNFSSSAGQKLYFDGITGNSSIDVRLISPSGAVLLNNIDVNSNSGLPNLLETGTYSLLILGNNPSSLSYSFQLLASGSTLTLDRTPINGTLGAGQTAIYQLSGSAGQRLYLDSLRSASANWRLVGPANQQLASTTLGSDLDLMLPGNGDYWLVLENTTANLVDYSFAAGIPQFNTNTLALGSLSANRISVPGQQDAYTFNGSVGQRLYFDGIGGSSNLDVRLTSPSGAVILNNIDVNSNNGFFVLPEAGTYTLVVDGVTDAVGDYNFQLLENGSTLTLDNTAINGTLSAGQTTIYQFSGSAGQRLYLDSKRSASATWRVIGPALQQLGTSTTSLGSDLDLTLTGDGNYWLVLENTTANLVDYSFAAGIAQSSSTALSLGNLVIGRLDTPGQQNAYTFNGSAGQKFYFDGISGNSNLDVRLVSPSGTVILNNIDVNSNNGFFVLPEAGTYTLVVDGVGEVVGDYSFRLLENGSTLVLDNAAINGTLAAGQTTIYQFSGSTGQRLYLDSKKSASATWRVIGPANQQLVSTTSLGSDLELTLTGDGNYWLVLENTTATAQDYSFAAGIPQPSTSALTLGSLVTSRISAAGEQDAYTFNGSAGQRLYFDGITGSSNLDVRLVSPSGTVILNSIDVNSNNGSFSLLETGTYTLTVDGVTDTVGDYSFRLWDSGNALTLNNTAINGRLAASETTIYQFSGSAGQRLFFDSLRSASGTWKLLGASNQQLATNNLSTDFGLTLSGNGNYWLVLENTSASAVDYSFAAQVNSDAPMTASGFGTLHSGTIAAGQQQSYTFTANAGSLVYFDSQDVDSDPINVQLTDPSGIQVFSTSASTDRGVLTLSRAGTYTLTVRGNTASATGDYGFQMLNLSDGADLSLNTLVSGSLTSKDAVGTYTFSSSAGQKLYFDGIAGNSSIDVQLISPSGAVLLNNIDVNANSGPLNLLETGTYSLLVLGNNATSPNYSFRLLTDDTALVLNTSYGFNELAFTTPEKIGSFVRGSLLSGGFEDGYEAINTALNHLPFRRDAAANIILITDEDRDVWDANLNFTNTLAALDTKNVRLNAVVSANFVDGTNKQALGMTPNGTVYLANGSGGFTSSSGGRYTTGGGTTKQDYVDLAWANGGSAWNISQFRGAGASQALNATSFTKAFVAANVSSISQQLSLNLIATQSNAGFSNLTGTLEGVTGGQTVSFTGQFTGNGLAQVYDLLLVRPDTGLALGSVPVVINGAYVYDAQAVDPDGDTLTYKLLKAPGGATIDATTGYIRWLPTQIGEYEFSVETNDGRGGIATQAYKLSVKELPNIAPTMSATPPVTATAGQPISYTVSATDADANSLSYFVVNAPVGLTIDKNSGWIDWTPTSTQLGEHSLQVRVLDGRGKEVTSEIKLTVVADSANLAPEFTSTEVTQVELGQSYRYTVSATDRNHDPLTFKAMLLPEGMSFDAANQVLVWQPDAAQLGDHTVVLRVEDGRGGFDLQAFQIKVSPPNTAPVITSTPPVGVTAVVGRPYQYQIQAIDADGESLTYRLDTAPAGMVINQTTGMISWTPTADSQGTQEVTIAAIDARGGKTTKTFNLSVLATAPNDAPTITSTPRNQITLGQPYLYTVTASDPNGDPLTYSLDTAPAGMTIDSNGQVFFLPPANSFGSNLVTIKVSDGQGGVASQSFNLDVTSTTNRTNSPPSITSNPSLAATVARLYQYNLTATDPENDTVAWGLDSAPAGMSIDPLRGTLLWTPNATQMGDAFVTVRAQDSLGGYAVQTFTLTVRGANTSPAITSTPLTVAAAGKAYTYAVVANDIESDPLTFALTSAPTGMTIDALTGVIRWTPSTTQVGTQEVQLQVLDALGDAATQRYAIAVSSTAANTAPAITSNPGFIASVGSAYTYQVTATDPDGDALTYQLIQAPSGMVIDAATGKLTWASPVAGQYSVVIGVNDGRLGVAQGFTLTSRVNSNPVIRSNSVPPTEATPNVLYSYDVRATDPEAGKLTYSLDEASRDKGMTLDNLGRLRWMPTNNAIGTHAIALTVTDDAGASVQQQYNLTVAADTVAPIVRVIAGWNIVNPGERVTFQAVATDNIKVASLQLLINNTPVILDALGFATVTLNQPGVALARAYAIDTAGNTSNATTAVQVTDPTDTDAPTVNLDLGAIATKTITAPTNIIGTVTDTNLAYYTLEVAPVGSDDFNEVFRGTSSVTNGVLGKFDPSLLQNDTYTLRLSAYDTNGQGSIIEDILSVAGDLKLGNFRLSFTDLSIPVTGIPISLTRTYDTLTSNTRDDFGYGWRMEFRDTDLRTSLPKDIFYQELDYRTVGFQDGTRVYITLPGGVRQGFTFKARVIDEDWNAVMGYRFYYPTFVADKGVTSTLSVPDAKYQANIMSGSTSGNGNNILFYDAAGDLINLAGRPYYPGDNGFGGKYLLTTTDGVVYEIDANTGDLNTVTDTNGNKLTYTDADITSSTGQKITFGRDAQGRITTVSDPLGNQVKYEYDTKGDLVAVTDREGNITKYEYNGARSHYLDKIVDPVGRTGAKTEYDELGRLKKIIDAAGNPVEMVYDLDHSTQTVKDALGNPTTYEYDERGNILTEIDPVSKITKRTYDSNNNVLTETIITNESGSKGWTTTYTYDSQNNRISVTDRLGQTIRYTYDKQGNVLSVTDPLGNATTYTYDSRRNQTSLTDAAGNITLFGYDYQGNTTSVIDANGEHSYLKYDSFGNLIETKDALGNKVSFTYNTNGQLLTKAETVSTAKGLQEIVNRWNYNSEGKIVSTVDPEGKFTYYEYDANGNKVSQIDALQNKTRFVYNNSNLLVETIYPDQTPEDLKDNPRIIHLYDRSNRRRATIDQSGQATYYNYNSMGWLIETIYPKSTDNLSLLIAAIAPNQTVETINWANIVYPDLTPKYLEDNPRVKTEYYQNGWIKADIDERSNRIEYRYNERGELIEEIYPDKTPGDLSDNPRTKWTYNAEGDLISTKNSLGHTTNYKYDELNRLIETHFPDGTFTSIIYDALDRKTSFTDQAGNTTKYRYDSNSQLTGVCDALGNWTEYGYDEVGRMIWMEDANNRRTYYEYNSTDQRTSVTLPNQQRSESTYNAMGLIKSFTDFNQQTTTFAYDAQSRLVSKTFSDHTFVNYAYTPTNNLASITDSHGTTTYKYDERNRLIARTDPTSIYLENGSTIEYGYDAASNITSISTPGGRTTYTYDERNRLETTFDPSQGTTRYFYDNFSNLVQTELPNGVIGVRQYDKLNRLTSLKHSFGETTLSSYKYTLDSVGNRLSILENNERLVEYKYDNLYRLTQEKITDQFELINDVRVISYTYDNVGNRLNRNDSYEGITSYEYNQNDWLLSETLKKDGETISFYKYNYDKNGNTSSRIKNGTEKTTYQWNPENRLIGVELPDSSKVTYIYDANGNRVSSTVNGKTTNYIVDTNRLNSEVIEEYIDGTLDIKYIHGLDLISQKQADQISIYLGDGLGSIRILTDKNSNITDTYTYDAFGELILSTGETDNSYRYAGEQYDENLDGYYLRQRYYDPSVGRFVSQDPFEGILSDPLTLHNFTYAHNNPVMNTDPSGLLLTEWQAALVNIGILSSTSTGISLTPLGIGTVVTGLLAIGATVHTLVAISRDKDGKVVGDDYVFVPKIEEDGHNRVFPSEDVEKLWNKKSSGNKDEDKNFNQMRIQIQGGGVEESVTGINLPDPGVLKRQMNVAASQLFLKAQSGSITNFPKDHISALGAALGHLTIFINKATGISQGGTVQTAQWDQPSGRDLRTGANKQSIKRPGTYRTDLENSRGTNLNK